MMNRRGLMKAIAGLLTLPLVGRNMASSASDGLRCCVVNEWSHVSDYQWRGRLIGCKAVAGLKLGDEVYIENGIAYPCTKENPLIDGIVSGIECES